MIDTLAQKLVYKYDNLAPKHKALFDMLGILFCSILGGTMAVVIITNGWWLELAICLIAYGVWGMIKLLYLSRVAHYEFQEKFNKK